MGFFGDSYIFDFAISFSGESRSDAKKLTQLLVDKGADVFYDNAFLEHLLGKRLDKELSWVFGAATHFFVPFVSAEYARKPWPQYEWSIAKQEEERRQEEFILPLRVDDTLLVGLPDTVCYLDLRSVKLCEVADILFRKLEASAVVSGRAARSCHWIVTFGLLMETLGELELPAGAPVEVPTLYDWLTKDLVNRFARQSLTQARVIEELRTGETLSVRLGFAWNPSRGALDFGDLEWWELLELVPYEDVYGKADGG